MNLEPSFKAKGSNNTSAWASILVVLYLWDLKAFQKEHKKLLPYLLGATVFLCTRKLVNEDELFFCH